MLFSKKYALISGVNGEIEYDIIKGDPYAVFKIDKSTGSISVGKQLDYEQIPVYNIVIQAQDRGFYPKSATSSVKIILLDVNDNPPTFDETLFEAVLKENSPPGTFVTQMIANDLDSPKNADISYGKILFVFVSGQRKLFLLIEIYFYFTESPSLQYIEGGASNLRLG